MFFKFLWNKPAKIKKCTIIGSIEDGGLKIIDIKTVHLVSKCIMIKRLLSEKTGKWQNSTWAMLNMNKTIYSKNPDLSLSMEAKTIYHKQLLKCWFHLVQSNPVTPLEVVNQFVLYNKEIKIENNMLTRTFMNNRFNELRINDIMTEDGNLISRANMSILLNTVQ